MRFVSEPLVPGAQFVSTPALSQGEPPLPSSFAWHGETLVVAHVLRSWRSTKTDRGDAYLARHWFELATPDGHVVVVYFDRKALRSAPKWWLYTIDDQRRVKP